MTENPSTFGLNPKKLGQILRVCSESEHQEERMTANEQKADLLQDRLSETLLTGSPREGTMRKELRNLCHMSGLMAGVPIRDLLLDPYSDVQLLRKIKEHGKKLSQDAHGEAEHDTANVMYYASIASAIVQHTEKITKFSYENLNLAFEKFIETLWIDKNLSNLFRRASAYCKEQMKKTNKE